MVTWRWTNTVSLLRRWSRDWGGALVLGLAAFVLIYAGWWRFRWGPTELQPLLADLAFLPGSLVAAVVSWRASTQKGAPLRKAWRFAALAQVCWFLGNAAWVYYGQVGQTKPSPSLVDIFYIAGLPLMFTALLVVPRPQWRKSDQLQFWLDASTVLLAGWMVVWILAVGPGHWLPNQTLLAVALTLAYPLGELLLLAGVVMLMVRSPGERYRAVMATLSAGLLLFVIANVGSSHLRLHGGYQSGDWPDLFSIASTFFMAAGAHMYRDAQFASVAAGVRGRRGPLVYLPYAAVAISSVFLVVVARAQGLHRFVGFLYVALTITLLVLVRQIMMLLENDRLLVEGASLTASLRRSEERFRTLVQNSSDVITVIDVGGTVQDQSSSIERVFGYRPGELIGQKLIDWIHPDDRDRARAFPKEVAAGLVKDRTMEVRFLHRDGHWRHTETTFTSLLHDPNVRALVLNTRDISERKALEEQLRHQAFHDPLTGLANRVLFRQAVEQALESCGPSQGEVAVLFLDLDGFKTVNDSLGHDAGDQLLVLVAERFRGSLRSADQVARLGGDEFGILLERVNESGAVQTAGRLLDALEEPFRVQGKEVFVRASLGIAMSTRCRVTAEELLRNADVAMYTAKSAGKGRYALFEPTMHAAALRRLELEADLRRALEAGELELYYQPTVDLRDEHIVGVEALLRWYHPERGMVLPAEFIPLAEETGLILPIGRWVLQEACARAKLWHERFPTQPPLDMNINISGKQILHAALVDEVAQALESTGLNPHSLVLEITESVLMQNPDAVSQRLQELKQLGVRMAVDDFGTGYSSLSYLQRFPVDIIKIDRSFIRDMGEGQNHRALTRSITDLAAALEMETVAEGIEEEWQAIELRQLDCQMGQGYFFARPVAAQTIDDMLTHGCRNLSQSSEHREV